MLTVNNLSFAFGARRLFESISFDLKPGHVIRLSGPNGAGKSTLMSILAGLNVSSSGNLSFESPSGSYETDHRQWTAWIPPDANALQPNLSAVQNLSFWLDVRGRTVSTAEFSAMLSDWGLTGVYVTQHLPVGLFSTGMKRRLALARLMLSKAKLWLLDEPLFGLDAIACEQLRRELKEHLDQGGSAVVITHDDRLLENLPFATVSLGSSK
ncbi:MAG: heme ABC exporter ATP-binding protein CcmA [Proteobacteria bacterium]|nr:heme ABC exporter ATP-binding protein CcmA [Pseudomonadota bacterium]